MARERLTPEDFTDPERARARQAKAEQRVEVQVRRTMRRVFKRAVARLVDHAAVTAAAVADPDDLAAMVAEWDAAVRNELLPLLGDTWLGAADDAARAFGGTIAFDLRDPRAEQILANAGNRLVGASDRTWGRAREEVLLGMEQGLSISKIQANVQGVMNADLVRATTIARTETLSAYNAGAVAGVKALGADGPSCKEWLATGGPRTRESHADADGQVVPLNEFFIVGGWELDQPGDPTGPPDEVINCRCTVLFVDCPQDVLDEQVDGTVGDEDTGEVSAPPEFGPEAAQRLGFQPADTERAGYLMGRPVSGDLRSASDGWHGNLNAMEQQAVQRYTRDGNFMTISADLTAGDTLEAAIAQAVSPLDRGVYAEWVEALDRSIDAAPDNGTRTLYRGVTIRGDDATAVLRGQTTVQELVEARMAPGDVIEWNAWSSTSVNPAVAVQFAGNESPGFVFEIRTSKGAPVLQHSSFPGEDEVLLRRGTRAKVVNIESGVPYVDAYGHTSQRTVVQLVVED